MKLPWQPIEHAPKDKAVLLFYPDCYGIPLVALGNWFDDYHDSYWYFQNDNVMESDKRKMMPTHFCEINYPEDQY